MCHALVIEDDWLIADHIICLIEQAGATSIAQADTQDAAIEQARNRRPDIIVSDVKLLQGTGPAAVQRILSQYGDLPVIFVTGTPEDCIPFAPPMVILNKPVNDAVVVDTFRRLAPR